MTAGASALRAWLATVADRGIGAADVAHALSVAPLTVQRWAAGSNRPGWRERQALQVLAGVPAEAWDTAREREAEERRSVRVGRLIAEVEE